MNLGQHLGGQQFGGQQIGGQQIGGQMINPMYHEDHAPHRHVEAHQRVPDPQPPHRQEADAYWADKIAEVMRDQFGIKPKVNTYSYRTPYPPAYDLIPLPNWYKVPHFTKFSGQDDTSTMEHINRFIIQCGEAANRDELRVRLFSSSLSGSAFTWFMSLPPNSVITWADLEKQFHKYFFSGVHEKKITDLVKLKQRNDESVESFVQRIREVKNKCYSLVLDDRQLADLVFQGLLPDIRDTYASQEFESLSNLVQRIFDQHIKPFEPKRAWNKKVSFVDEVAISDSDEEPVIGLAEWVKNKKLMSCPSGHKEPEKFAFDITKTDSIFDFLLQEGQIKLSPNHVIPSAKELKKMKYCKWHNATSHSTNECKVFRQQLQSAIESGRIQFDSSKTQKPMKIDQHPFSTNMLDAKGKAKVLTSEAAERSASVDPQHQITTADAKGKGLIQEGTNSARPPRSGIIITYRRPRETWQQREDRYRRQQEDYHREEERRRQEWNRHRDHWNCPFFIHCWEENIKLPTVRDCPECNGYDRYDRSNRQYQNNNRRFDGPIRGRASVHDRLGGRLSVHDRFGDRVEYFPRNQEELEEMVIARVPDEFIFCRDANTYRMESRENCRPSVRQQQLPPWCPEELTRTQKRRLQRERREELNKGENSGLSGDQKQSDPKEKGPSADVNMVFMLPMEFLAPSSDDELEFSDQIAQLALDLMTAIFEKPADDERQHLKALFVKGTVDGQPMTRWWSCHYYHAICSISEVWKRGSRFDQDRYDVKRLRGQRVSG